MAVKGCGSWSGPAADQVVLDYDGRQRRRVVLRCESGSEVLLDLAAATGLGNGDALVLEDGTLIAVQAAAERLLELRTADALQTVQLAWHLGNRHVPAQLTEHAVRIRPDHVLADLARRLGATVTELEAPFLPERGAYASGFHEHGRPPKTPIPP